MIDRVETLPRHRPEQAGRCACGQPLHYTSPGVQDTIEQLIRQLGPTVRLHCDGKYYLVSRHYIALHGVKAKELAALAAQGIITEVTDHAAD